MSNSTSSTEGVKHTPAPWFVDMHGNVMAAGGLVAFPGIAAGFDQAANARLIAAAPDLLAALDRLMNGQIGLQDALDAAKQARAAIALATKR